MFENLTQRLGDTLSRLTGRGRLTEENIDEAMRDVRRALLEADMNFGTIWVQLPDGAESVPVSEAIRRVREVDKHVESIDLDLWQRWARLVLQRG